MNNSRVFPALLCASLCSAVALFAVETKYWQQSDMADFEKGTLTRLSLSSEGHLTLAPVVKELYDPSVTFLWTVARDSKGNLYTGGGSVSASKAKLIVIDASGKAKTLAELDGMAVQAIAIDRQDRVYAATSPDGKVYRVDTNVSTAGKSEVFYDPHAKYIWALAFSRSGDLFVATGDQGEIHRVTPAGAGSVFFKTEEAHARSLTTDANNNLIVGTDPSGLILRITPAGEGFVLYQSPKREITAVAVAPDGTIYAAGAGAKQPATLPPPQPAPSAPSPAGNAPGSLTLNVARPGAPPSLMPAGPPVTTGSEIYRIQADGYPRKIWSHAQDVVYALAFDSQGHVIAGTGNHGAIYRIDSDHTYTRLLNLESTQVTGFCGSPDGKLYAVTGNIGKVIAIGPQMESTGTFESDVYDAGAFTYWGRLSADPTGQPTSQPSSSGVSFETRSGNLSRTQRNWSPWAKLDAGRIVSPAARFIQYKATLTSGARPAGSTGSPEVSEVDIAYLMKNIAPVIEQIETTAANYKFPAPSASTASSNPTLTLPPLGRNQPSSSPLALSDSGNSTTLTWSKGQIGARWLATDDNGDTLAFQIEIRGVNETGWKLLKDKIHERYYSWDSTAFPDGKYVVRVTASDAPSNPPDQALTATLQSDPFLIDNTAPEITSLRGTPSGAKIEVRFHAKDAASTIGKAEYSVNGGDWIVVEPVTRLSDSQEEDYRVMVDRTPGETTIAVRVADEYENQSVAKAVVK
jgi:sugar lactone lactonase YvrE